MKTPSTISSISQILVRDLQKIVDEVELYKNEDAIWVKGENINNAAGNLALHIAGSIHHFIGAVLGKNGFVRNRDKEFSLHGVPREEIVAQLKRAIDIVPRVLENLTEEETFGEFPEKIGGNVLSVNLFLVHVVSHVNYHLGQINYHRRLLNG